MFNININDLLSLPGKVGVFWKDTAGHYLGCNDVLADICKLSSRHEIVGRLDFDLPMLHAEALALREGDKKVIQAGCAVQFQYSITDHDKVCEFVTFKAPLFDANGKIVGVFGIDNYLTSPILHDAMRNAGISINPKQLKYTASPKISKRQIDIICYMIKGMTAKQTATKLGISHRTIEHHIENIKLEFGTRSRSELIAKVLQFPEVKNRLMSNE